MRIRLAKLREWLAGSGLDAILITQAENRRYLSGFSGSAGSLLISMDRAILATDFRYVEQSKQQAPELEVFRLEESLAKSFPVLVQELGASRVGFEDADLTYAAYQELRQAVPDAGATQTSPVSLEPTSSVVEQIRMLKDELEVGYTQKAAEIADAALAHATSLLKPGVTELAIAWEMEKFMRENGAESVSFDTIVVAGPRGALPHASPTDRAIREGEPIVIDFGARYHGYCSDCTRTLILGEPDETFVKVYNTVLRAQRAAMKAVRPGAPGVAVDGVARQVIADAGYGQFFGHGLGHGTGLAVHERPTLRKTSTDQLGESMLFTIEPGIYLPGWGGVRIEDLATIEQGELRILTKAGKTEEIGGKS
ncbi:MAG: aminopeptidase P family protein [Chloroflexi bacterium]|nr:aminopeptidase P family protein [Chloroflexota bacterium]